MRRAREDVVRTDVDDTHANRTGSVDGHVEVLDDLVHRERLEVARVYRTHVDRVGNGSINELA